MRVLYTTVNRSVWDIADAMTQRDKIMFDQGAMIADKFETSIDQLTAFAVWQFLRNDIKYKADAAHQKIKTPYRLLKSGVGDCKSYAVFAAAVLRNLGFRCSYIFSADYDVEPSHVFVVAEKNGVEYIIDATINHFDTLPFFVDLWQVNLPSYENVDY